MQSGATPPPRLLLRQLGLRGYTLTRHKVPFVYPCLTQRQKKKSPVQAFSTFLCQTLKRIYLSLSGDCQMWSLCRNHYTSNRYQGGLQLDLIKIFLKLKAIFVKENLRFKTLIYISFSYIKSLSDFYHYGESWRRSGNTHPRASIKTLQSITRNKSSITTEPSHRFTGAYQSLFLRLFWLGIDHP